MRLVLRFLIIIKILKKINIDKYSKEYIQEYLDYRKPQLMNDFRTSIYEIEKIKLGGRILDVGCGTGIFLETLIGISRYKWMINGIDISKYSITKARPEIRKCILNKSINNNNFANNYFDVVTCYDVLEHSSDIRRSLFEIRRILKKDGLVVIQVPNSNSIMSFLSKNDWDWWCVPDHVYHFTKSSIVKVLNDQDFRVLKIRTWENSEIFIKNIQGHYKKILPKIFSINRIISKLIFVPLYIFWYISNKVSKKYQRGGLIHLLAQKI